MKFEIMEKTIDKRLELKQKLIQHFHLLENRLNGSGNTTLNQIRKEAIHNFESLGFPVTSLEEWRHTTIEPILNYNYQLSTASSLISKEIEQAVAKFSIPDLDADVLVFVNGVYSKELSKISLSPLGRAGEGLGSFADAQKENSALVEKHFAEFAAVQKDAFGSLNTAFASNGAWINIPDNTIWEKPIHLLFLSEANRENILIQTRNIITLGKNSQCSVIETHHQLGNGVTFCNQVVEIAMNENSILHYHKIQNLRQDNMDGFLIDNTLVEQQKNSSFHNMVISLNGSLVRNNLNVLLNAETAESHLYGLYLLNQKQLVDNHTLVDHNKPHCTSNELYKGVLDGKAKGVFNGKIIVRPNAQKTNAYQSNKNILLSNDCVINTKPQLEIFANDVRCTHGATSGQLDKEMLFYLRTRGIGEEEAKAMLIDAFASEIVEKVKIEPLRIALNMLIATRLNRKVF